MGFLDNAENNFLGSKSEISANMEVILLSVKEMTSMFKDNFIEGSGNEFLENINKILNGESQTGDGKIKSVSGRYQFYVEGQNSDYDLGRKQVCIEDNKKNRLYKLNNDSEWHNFYQAVSRFIEMKIGSNPDLSNHANVWAEQPNEAGASGINLNQTDSYNNTDYVFAQAQQMPQTPQYQSTTSSNQSTVMSTLSIVFGSISLGAWIIAILGLGFSVVGLVTGIIAKVKRVPGNTTLSITFSSIGLLASLINMIAGAIMAISMFEDFYNFY